MARYTNEYFGLRIEFPERWELVSWKQSKIRRSSRALYQMRDNELPEHGLNASKFLFTACRFHGASKVTVDADIEVSVFRVDDDKDFTEALLENHQRMAAYHLSQGVTCSIANQGLWKIKNVSFNYVDEGNKSKWSQSQYRFFFRRIHGVFWLYGKIAGYKDWAFTEAIAIVEGLDWTPPAAII